MVNWWSRSGIWNALKSWNEDVLQCTRTLSFSSSFSFEILLFNLICSSLRDKFLVPPGIVVVSPGSVTIIQFKYICPMGKCAMLRKSVVVGHRTVPGGGAEIK